MTGVSVASEDVLARSVTHALVGLEPRRVEVEAHIDGGVPGFAIVGLADRACSEAKHRVRSGIGSAQLEWPLKRITVNLAPAGLRKEGSGFDLSIALAVLAASRQVPADRLAAHAAVGELALDGRIRPVRGAFAVAEGARRAGLERILCAPESACEAELGGVEAVPVRHLAEAVAYLRGELRPPPAEPPEEVAGARAARSRRRARPGAGAPGARARGGRRAQPAARRAAGNRQDDARTAAAVDPAAARAARGARGDADPLGRGRAAAGAAADHAASVPRAAPQRLDGGDRRRRRRPAAGRGEPRAPRRPAARRAAGVPASGARGAAPAARGRRRRGRARRRAGALSGPLPARRDDEPVPVRRPRRSRGRVLVLAAAARVVPRQALAGAARPVRPRRHRAAAACRGARCRAGRGVRAGAGARRSRAGGGCAARRCGARPRPTSCSTAPSSGCRCRRAAGRAWPAWRGRRRRSRTRKPCCRSTSPRRSPIARRRS